MIYEHICVRMGKNVLLQVKIVSVQKLLFKTTEAINFRRFDHEKIRKNVGSYLTSMTQTLTPAALTETPMPKFFFK